MEHQVPQLPELMTDFRVTQRHRGGLPARGNSAPNADYERDAILQDWRGQARR
jgi:hypothetical protein